MPYIDLPLDQLRAYRPELDPPADLAAFWTATLANAGATISRRPSRPSPRASRSSIRST